MKFSKLSKILTVHSDYGRKRAALWIYRKIHRSLGREI